jgi:hypothetical protein
MDAILFELSNSTTLAGRFPDDEEFKKSLMSNVNTNYARVLLLKIEEHETQNIPVEISDVTVEHLMPQTLSEWWKTYLGGEVVAESIHSDYLNCIGNLTPVSQSYNSSMSNKPWNEKLVCLKDVQFTITAEVADNYTEWGLDNLSDRNNSMANRAAQAITSPLSRTRPLRTKSVEDYSPGIYSVSDLTTQMNGSTPIAIHYKDCKIECTRWRDVLNTISGVILEVSEQQFAGIVSNNSIHKATSKKNYPNKDPIFSDNRDLLVEPLRISESKYFCEGCISSIRARVYAKQLLELFNCIEDFSIEIS